MSERYPGLIQDRAQRAADLDAAAERMQQRIQQGFAIAEGTLKVQMKAVLAKLGPNDRTHAVRIALQRHRRALGARRADDGVGIMRGNAVQWTGSS